MLLYEEFSLEGADWRPMLGGNKQIMPFSGSLQVELSLEDATNYLNIDCESSACPFCPFSDG